MRNSAFRPHLTFYLKVALYCVYSLSNLEGLPPLALVYCEVDHSLFAITRSRLCLAGGATDALESVLVETTRTVEDVPHFICKVKASQRLSLEFYSEQVD